MVSLLFLISRMTQWSPVSFFTSLLIAYSLFTRTIPTFTKHFCWNSCQNQALLPRLPSTNIFRFLVYTTLSHSLPPPLSLSLSPFLTPYNPHNRLLTQTSLPISWILTTVRGGQSEGGDISRPVDCFDYSRDSFVLVPPHPYTLPPTSPLRHVGPGLPITFSRTSKYDSPLPFHIIHARCTISFSNRCHVTDCTTLYTAGHSYIID